MNHAAELKGGSQQKLEIINFTSMLRKALENTFRYGQGTKDMAGPNGLSTERFIDKVTSLLSYFLTQDHYIGS